MAEHTSGGAHVRRSREPMATKICRQIDPGLSAKTDHDFSGDLSVKASLSAPSHPLPEAIVAVVRKARRVLVIRRGPLARLPGYWSPPSGRIEPGEKQEQTVVREVREEVGLRVRPLVKVWECVTDDGVFLLHWWAAEVAGGSLRLERGEASEARWANTQEFLELQPTFVGDREFFRSVLPHLERRGSAHERSPR